jgi:uncharacterized membrane protein
MTRSVKFHVLISGVSGVVDLARPEVFQPLMPSWVPAHRSVILGGGVAELACAAGTHSSRLKVAAFGRLPLQMPMIRWALRAARD